MTKLIEFIIYAVVLIAALALFKSATQTDKQIKDSMIKFEAQQTVNELTNLYRQMPSQ